MNRLLFTFLLAFIVFTSTAQQTHVSGTINKKWVGLPVYLEKWNDYYSNAKTVISSDTIDVNGLFHLESKEITEGYYIVRVAQQRIPVYWVGDAYYSLKLFAHDNFRNHLIKISPVVECENKECLNNVIFQFDSTFNSLAAHFPAWKLFQNYHAIRDSILTNFDTSFSTSRLNNHFFNEHKKYRFAELLSQIGENRDSIYNVTLEETKIPYNNPAFFQFFHSFFNNKLTEINLKHYNDWNKALQDTNSYKSLIYVIQLDKMLQREDFAELVLLRELSRSNKKACFEQNQVVNRLLTQIANTSSFKEHQSIAKRLLKLRNQFKPGQPTPELMLNLPDGNSFDIKEFENRFVYILFWSTRNKESMQDLILLENLHKKYHKNIEFVSICTDRDDQKMNALVKQRRFAHRVLHFNRDFDLLEEWGVKHLPMEVLIDPLGKIMACPAQRPAKMIQKFEEIHLIRLGRKRYELINSYD